MSAASQTTNPLFDKRLIAAYVDSVVKTIKTMANTDVTSGKAFIEPNFLQKGDVAGNVGIVAPPVKGNLLICFETPCILTIVENMIGEKHNGLTKEVCDAVGELTNMVYGSSKTALNQIGYNFEMAIPTVISGKFKLSHAEGAPTLVIPFTVAGGSSFYIQITVQV